MIELRSNARPEDAITVLRDLETSHVNVTGLNTQPVDRLNAWRQWSAQAPAKARSQFTDRGIREVILGSDFVMLQNLAVSDYGPGLHYLIDSALRHRENVLKGAIKEIDDDIRSWRETRVALVLDTGVLLNAGPRIAKIDWNRLLGLVSYWPAYIVPIQAVEELDRHKRNRDGELRSNASYAVKWLNQLFGAANGPIPFPDGGSRSSIRVWVDENDRVPLAEVDRDIIDLTQRLVPFTERTIIASMDQSMVFRAHNYGLEAVLLTAEDIPARSDSAEPVE